MNPYAHHTDSELLNSLRTGNEAVFGEIYARYAQKLYRYARLRVRAPEECREIVQEAFETLWKSSVKVRELGPFLFTVLKFRIIKFYEHRAVEKKFIDYMTMFEADAEVPDEAEPELERLRGMVNHTMAELPQRCQDALKLRIDENLSLDDIALRMEVTRDSVKRYLTMAMNHLRKQHVPIYKSK